MSVLVFKIYPTNMFPGAKKISVSQNEYSCLLLQWRGADFLTVVIP
jgi:hypothetical protein